MELKRYKPLYLPALVIVTTVLILLLVIAFSTYHNLDRERVRMEEALLREGRAVAYSLAAALKADSSPSAFDSQRLSRLLADISRDRDIQALAVITAEGRVVAASRDWKAGHAFPETASLTALLQEQGLITRYDRDPKGERTFEIMQPFQLFVSPDPALTGPTGGGDDSSAEPLRSWSQDKIIALSLRLQVYDTARRADIEHLFLMGGILIILAVGALYFILIVQRYYRVDRTLGQMKSYLENVVDSMADGLVSLDNQGRIVTMNRQAAAILAVKMAALEGKAFSEILGEGSEVFLQSARVAVIREREMELELGQGQRIPISLSAAPLKDELGHDMGLVVIIKDLREIQDLKENIRRSERLASLGRLAAGMAHEIRNPLSSIRGFAQFFQKRFQGQQEEEEYAGIMVREVDRLDRVITDLLDFARPREIRRSACFLERIIDDNLQLLAMKLKAKNVSVEKNYEKDLPSVLADQEQISQAVLNLLLNALDAVAVGGKIDLGLRCSADRGSVEITIADDGPGIPAEDREKIFEPFFSTKRKGTGLGLAIVNQIVESHGGEIRVEDRSAGGTIFTIDLKING